MDQKRILTIGALVTVAILVLSLILIIGTDTSWGKVEVTRMILTSAEGDQISAMLYKPKNASPDNPVPLAMITHGGNDMLEQAGSYAIELSRRGYAVVTWDYTGCHNSIFQQVRQKLPRVKFPDCPPWEQEPFGTP